MVTPPHGEDRASPWRNVWYQNSGQVLRIEAGAFACMMSWVSKNSHGAQVHGAAFLLLICLSQRLLEGGECAQVELAHTLTLHLRSRTFPTRRAHASTVRLLADLADRAAGRTPAAGSRPITSVCPLISFAAADMLRPVQRAP